MNERLENTFSYHAPKEGQPEMYEFIRDTLKAAAYNIEELCPDSREKSLALTKLEEAMFWANASIARTGHVVEMPEPIVVDDAEVAQYVHQKTDIDLPTIVKVLDAEMQYLNESGVVEGELYYEVDKG